MSQIESFALPEISLLAEHRQSRVLVLSATKLELEQIPELFELMTQLGYSDKLDVVLYGRGGEINATRRIALLLNEFCQQLSFIVPHYCQSAFTLLALSGNEIVSGELAMFSPIDPGLTSHTAASGAPDTLSSEDIRLFFKMTEQWFGIQESAAKQQAMASLMGSIFPANLTALYRANLEQKYIGEELLGIHQPGKQHIVEQLMEGYHSHHFSLSGKDLENLGLKVSRDEKCENLAWSIARKLNAVLGSRAMQSVEDPLTDTLFATEQGIKIRQRHPHVPAPKWLDIAWK